MLLVSRSCETPAEDKTGALIGRVARPLKNQRAIENMNVTHWKGEGAGGDATAETSGSESVTFNSPHEKGPKKIDSNQNYTRVELGDG